MKRQFVNPSCTDTSSVGEEFIDGSGLALEYISGQSGTWSPGTANIVGAISFELVSFDPANPPVFVDSRGVETPLLKSLDIAFAASDVWGAGQFTNVPFIRYSETDEFYVSWIYGNTNTV